MDHLPQPNFESLTDANDQVCIDTTSRWLFRIVLAPKPHQEDIQALDAAAGANKRGHRWGRIMRDKPTRRSTCFGSWMLVVVRTTILTLWVAI